MIIRNNNPNPPTPPPAAQMEIWQVTIRKGHSLEDYYLLARDYNDLHDQLDFSEDQARQIVRSEYIADVTSAPNPTNKIISV